MTPAAKVQTEPVPTEGDAADDPAIWIHPTDPARSLVLGTDKKGGLHAYSLDGRRRQLVSPGSRPNNVDVLYGFRLAGRTTDLAVASVGKGGKSSGVKLWTIDPAKGTLAETGEGPTFQVFGGGRPLRTLHLPQPGRRRGLCLRHRPRRGGRTIPPRQFGQEYPDTPGDARPRFRVGSQAEGVVADRERARLYVAEEDVGIWEYGAEPGDGDKRRAVAHVDEHGLAADVEGLALYYAPGGKGYILASSQGSSTVNVYERSGDHAYVVTIDPKAGETDDVAHTDGLDVTNEGFR